MTGGLTDGMAGGSAGGSGASTPSIDVVVPTYRRPGLLAHCLEALAAQTFAPARVVVALRPDDADSRVVVAASALAGLVEATVSEPGVLAALRAGVARTRAGIVAITDDDARPRPDWLERIVAAFADPMVGAVGGRIDVGVPPRRGAVVGDINRVGRLVGNHEIGFGGAREVDVVAGANSAFRAEALMLPVSGTLFGDGAEPHHEILLDAWVRGTGRLVVFDPAIVVDHRPAIDVLPGDDLARARESDAWTFAVAHNWVVGVTALGERPLYRVLAYGLGVGMRGNPGMVRAGAGLLRGEWEVVRRLPASIRGHLAGARHSRSGFAARVVSATELRGQPTEVDGDVTER